MTPAEADQLARRIVNLWRSTPSIVEWRDKLADSDYDRARLALTRLRDQHDGSLSIAQFVVAYNATATASTPTTGHPGRCELCDGTGVDGNQDLWLIIGGPRGEREGWAVEYRLPVPCRCTAGQRFPRTQPPAGVEYRYSPTPLQRTPIDPTELQAAAAAFAGATLSEDF